MKSGNGDARGFTAGQKNCGKSGLGHWACSLLGFWVSGLSWAMGSWPRAAGTLRALGRGPRKTRQSRMCWVNTRKLMTQLISINTMKKNLLQLGQSSTLLTGYETPLGRGNQ